MKTDYFSVERPGVATLVVDTVSVAYPGGVLDLAFAESELVCSFRMPEAQAEMAALADDALETYVSALSRVLTVSNGGANHLMLGLQCLLNGQPIPQPSTPLQLILPGAPDLPLPWGDTKVLAHWCNAAVDVLNDDTVLSLFLSHAANQDNPLAPRRFVVSPSGANTFYIGLR
jgi:hypothetical protein